MPSAHAWISLFIGSLGLLGFVGYLEAEELASIHIELDQLYSYKLTVYAHLLIAGSTGLYLAHLRWRAAALGLWASSLAGTGALALLGAVAVRASETWVQQRTHHIPLASLHDVMALFSACTVLIYLVMERAYRSRSAGAFVMPVVMAAVLAEAWMLAGVPTGMPGHFPSLHSYTVRLHVLVNVLAYGAFAVAAAMSLLYLMRARAAGAAGPLAPGQDDPGRIEQLAARSLRLGLVAFSAAILLGMQATHDARGSYWDGTGQQAWSLLVWANYAACSLARGRAPGRSRRMAWWCIAGFALALLYFLGANLLGGRVHAFT